MNTNELLSASMYAYASTTSDERNGELVAPPKAARRALRATSREAYFKDRDLFLRYGGTIPCDAAAVRRYVDLLRGKVLPLTTYRRIMAIQRLHVDGGYQSPTDDATVRQTLRWLQSGRYPPKAGGKGRDTDTVPQKREPKSAKPLTRQLLLRVLDAVHRTELDRRDRAMLLIAFMAGLKRSTLVSINVEDIAFSSDALLITIRPADGSEKRVRDKVLAIPNTGGELDTALAVRQLIEQQAMEPGNPLFRSFNRAGEPTEKRLSSAFVSEVVKNRVRVVGLDPTNFSGESMRLGRKLEVAKGLL